MTFLVECLDLDSSSYLATLGLAPMTGIICQMFISLVMGLVIAVIGVPHTNCPLSTIYIYIYIYIYIPIYYWKMVVGSIDQLPVVFEEGCQNQSTHPKGMVSVLCTSH